MLSTIVVCGAFGFIGALPVFNLDRASDRAYADKQGYLDAIATLYDEGRVDLDTYHDLLHEQTSVSFFAHRKAREFFRDPMALYPLLKAHRAV